jgi:hypothetical protein
LGDADRDGVRRLVQQLPSINVLVLTRLMLLVGKLVRAAAVTKVRAVCDETTLNTPRR